MNNFGGGNVGSPGHPPGGMKRPFPQDPRQRMPQQGGFPQGGPPPMQGGRFPGGGPFGGGRGPPPPPGAQQPHPGMGPPPGRGFPMNHPQQQQGRGGPPPQRMGPPPGGRGMNGRGPFPGRGPPPMGGPPMGGRGPGPGPNMHGRGPGMGPGPPMGGGIPPGGRPPQHMMGRPPPPPPQRQPFPPGGMINNNQNNRMHQMPPGGQGRGMGFGQNGNMAGPGAPPPPPPPRSPFQAQGPHPNQFHQSPPQMRPPPGNMQQLAPQQGMMPPMQAQKPPPMLQPPPNHHYLQGQAHLPPNAGRPPPQQPAFPAIPVAGPASVSRPPPQQRASPVVAASVASPKSISQYSQAQIDQAWSEHTNNGVKYYHNSITKTSTYEKPKALGGSAPAQPQQSQQQPRSTPATATPEGKRTWSEYTDKATGKKYYSDGATTTWEKPADYASPASIVAQSVAKEEAAAAAASTDSTKKKRKTKDTRETPFTSNEEAVAAFKGLLLAKGVAPTQKWNEVVKMCSNDPRWEDCEAVLTTGERKQAMAEYQTKRANELRTQERQERARAKDAFVQLLSEVVPKLSGFSVWKTRFSDMRDKISKDDRFYAVPNEETRESLFLDFLEELRKHDERKKRNKKRDTQEAFLSFLKEKEDAATLSFSSTWNTFLASLNASDKDDGRFKVSSAMSDSDRQLYFADFVIELQAAEDDKRRRIRDARRRAEKAQRDAYRDALEKLGAEGKLTPSSHWRDIERMMESDPAFKAVQEQDRDAPGEIFEEFVEEWDDIYRRDRQLLSQLVHPSSNREILVTKDSKYDSFVKALLEEANRSPQNYAEARRIVKTDEPMSSARLYFNELVKRAKEKAAVPYRRRSATGVRRSSNDSSSEDEGEIIEDGEVQDEKPGSKDSKEEKEATGGDVVATGSDVAKPQDSAVPSKEASESQETTITQSVAEEGKEEPKVS